MASRMKDIARDLSVSVITVSKVLRNHPDISEATRDRVLRRMKELNYRPNLAARSLVTGKSYSIGLIVPDLVHPFFAELAKGISRILRERGYGLMISSSEESVSLEQQEIDQMLARGVDALIIASTQLTVESFRQIEERRVTYVLLDRQFTGLPANFVGIDDERAGVLATEHLISVGCRRIAHIRGPDVSTSIGRLSGYQRALRRHSLDLPSEYVVREESGDESGDTSGYEAMKKLLAADPRPDGVFCYNDPTALGAMRGIVEAGLRIPHDIALIGCGNVNYAPLLTVPLSSIDQDNFTMGTRAGELALSLLASRSKSKPQTILMEPKVVARASSARQGSRE